MHPALIGELLVLLGIANGAPVLAKKVLRHRVACPVDAGLVCRDGRRLLGPSKTIRGIVVSVVLTTAAAPLLGIDLAIGALVGGMAMLGDLFSSFVKRRLDFATSSRATGLDQIPESLLPVLACRVLLPLSILDIFITVAAFVLLEIVLSPVFYRVGFRDRPF